ncbi:acetyltransferase [Noviherbaspirillum agri]
MAHFDVFNGDADGICSLHQLRLAAPCESVLVTGVKRDIALLERVNAHAGDSVTVLDVSSDVNGAALHALLERGVKVQYFDHHGSGEVPAHPGLDAHIDTSPATCTGIIVDRWLGGRFRIWAIVAAFGDNFPQEAAKLAQSLSLDAERTVALKELGECINYNAYGDTEDDLVMRPAELYTTLRRHTDPFSFMAEEPLFAQLREARREDMERARQVSPCADLPGGAVVVLPDTAWSRRVRGSYANQRAVSLPQQALAVATPNLIGGYTVSVRAPLARRLGADTLCAQFPTGSGRPAAAGITHLPQDQLPVFIRAFEKTFGAAGTAGTVKAS